MLTKEEYELFSTLLFFDNHLDDEKAKYIGLADHFLYRRDAVRLIAYQMEQKVSGIYHYLLSDLNKEENITLELEKDMLSAVSGEGEKKQFSPASVPFQANSIRALSLKEFHLEAEIETKSLVKTLLILQRKLMNRSIDYSQIEIALDFREKKLHVYGLDEELSYTIDAEVLKEEQFSVPCYSYLFFRDFLINAKSFGKTIQFSVYESYFTRIQYTEKVVGIINHKRKKEGEM